MFSIIQLKSEFFFDETVGELPTSFFSLNERTVTKGNCPKKTGKEGSMPKGKETR